MIYTIPSVAYAPCKLRPRKTLAFFPVSISANTWEPEDAFASRVMDRRWRIQRSVFAILERDSWVESARFRIRVYRSVGGLGVETKVLFLENVALFLALYKRRLTRYIGRLFQLLSWHRVVLCAWVYKYLPRVRGSVSGIFFSLWAFRVRILLQLCRLCIIGRSIIRGSLSTRRCCC